MKKVLTIILLAIAGSYGTANSQPTAVIVSDTAGWCKIGETTVDFQRDRDEVQVLGADRFKSIKFKVTDTPIDLKDIEVYYETGHKQDIKVNTLLKVSGESRVIDLEGGEQRSIEKIVLVYKTLPNRNDVNAHVEIWGLKTTAKM